MSNVMHTASITAMYDDWITSECHDIHRDRDRLEYFGWRRTLANCFKHKDSRMFERIKHKEVQDEQERVYNKSHGS